MSSLASDLKIYIKLYLVLTLLYILFKQNIVHTPPQVWEEFTH